MMTANGTSASARVDWVDYAKGICIVMVVMMHSVLGVEQAAGETGFMHALVAFAKPFRMPDFFLISGLFLAPVIDRDWRIYLDRKVAHFGYFYLLWVTIQFGFKASVFAAESGWGHVGFLYLESFIEPFGTLWFIYLLPIFFVVIKMTRGASPILVFGVAALLQSVHVATGWTVIDEFCSQFVYIYAGYLFASEVFALSARARSHPVRAAAVLILWALVNGSLVALGISAWPIVSLGLGLCGGCAIVTIGTLLARMQWLNVLRFCGEHSIVIYLAFFLPMAATRTLLLRSGMIHDIGMVSLFVTIVGVAGSVLIWRAALALGANFLFERPEAFWIAPNKTAPALPARQAAVGRSRDQLDCTAGGAKAGLAATTTSAHSHRAHWRRRRASRPPPGRLALRLSRAVEPGLFALKIANSFRPLLRAASLRPTPQHALAVIAQEASMEEASPTWRLAIAGRRDIVLRSGDLQRGVVAARTAIGLLALSHFLSGGD